MAMLWYQWMALISLGICLAACSAHAFRLLRKGRPVDYSRPAANSRNALPYAFTGAMSPAKKESAYLHLPTYTAGIFYHLGTFLSFFLFFFILVGKIPVGWLAIIITAFLFASAFSGIAIFIKRVVKKELRALSNPDDFISNILVTLFQMVTISLLLVNIIPLPNWQFMQLPYYFFFAALMLYTPAGKLRHMVYFFAARYHLGYFFGRRGVWPAE
jgi:hypothetical protein